MTPARRAFLLQIATAVLGTMVGPRLSRASPTAREPGDHRPTVDAFVDVLLPDDGVTPAASELGVGGDILAFVAGAPQVLPAFMSVCDALDGAGPARFAMLSGAARARLIDRMASAPPGSMEGWFYGFVRLLALEFYFARPEALAGLDLDPAPQPAGYLPPWA